MTATENEHVEKIVATAKLETLLEQPKASVVTTPDGGVKVTTAPLWKRVWVSWTMRLQAVTGILATIWLSIPQETLLAVIPSKYVASATLGYVILTAIMRMRTA